MDYKDGGGRGEGGRNRPTDILYTPTLKSLANFRIKVASLSLKVRAVFDELDTCARRLFFAASRAQSLTVQKTFGGKTQSVLRLHCGGKKKKRHSVQKSGYYS